MHVSDLVHRFLMDSGYSRASLVSDAEALYLNGDESQSYKPAFLVINPDNGDPLAVIDVSSHERSDQLVERAERTARYARKTGNTLVQAFVISADKSTDGTDQVRFVRVWPNKEYQNVSAQMFPDLEALIVARKLSLQKSERFKSSPVEDTETDEDEAPKAGRLWLPIVLAALMLVLALADWLVRFTRGAGFLELPQLLLIITAAVLACLPSMIGRSSKD